MAIYTYNSTEGPVQSEKEPLSSAWEEATDNEKIKNSTDQFLFIQTYQNRQNSPTLYVWFVTGGCTIDSFGRVEVEKDRRIPSFKTGSNTKEISLSDNIHLPTDIGNGNTFFITLEDIKDREHLQQIIRNAVLQGKENSSANWDSKIVNYVNLLYHEISFENNVPAIS